MRYKLVQPCDDYEFDAADDDIATVIAMFLGDGVGWERPTIDLDGSGYRPFRILRSALGFDSSLHQDEEFVLKRLDEALSIVRTPNPEPTEWIER